MGPRGSRSRLLIVQPYVPAYRVPLFSGMREALRIEGVDMRVAAARPKGAALSRGDGLTDAEADLVLADRQFRLGRRTINARAMGQALESFRPHLVIVEQAIKNLETYQLLTRSLVRRDVRVAMWGQGRSYSVEQSSLEAAAKQWLTRQSNWFFAYTAKGADHVARHGFDSRRITVLNNTIDTRALRSDLDSLGTDEVEGYRRSLGLTAGRTALFIGGVDEHKGIDFLLESAVEIDRRLDGFTLLVGGAGLKQDVVRQLERCGGPVRFLGRLDGRAKATALAAADLLMIPQWVGLVAVDSLVAGRPIVTTQHASHSPEFEYLRRDENSVVTAHSVRDYADGVADILVDSDRLTRLQQAARADSSTYDIQGMIGRFVNGILAWNAR